MIEAPKSIREATNRMRGERMSKEGARHFKMCSDEGKDVANDD